LVSSGAEPMADAPTLSGTVGHTVGHADPAALLGDTEMDTWGGTPNQHAAEPPWSSSYVPGPLT